MEVDLFLFWDIVIYILFFSILTLLIFTLFHSYFIDFYVSIGIDHIFHQHQYRSLVKYDLFKKIHERL